MDKRLFIILLVLLIAGMAGWFYYVSTQSDQSQSIEKISVDWWGSAHADITAEAFTHWNEDDPAVVPTSCAKCHSGDGFLDFLGMDGSAPMQVDAPARIESVVNCNTCHNEAAHALTTADFPAGITLDLAKGDSICATCHSGTRAGNAVASAAEGISDDEIIPDSAAVTPHYAFSAAVWLGDEVQGGFQYQEKEYAGRFEHAEGAQTCTDCHDPHSLHMREDYGEQADLCAACHSNVVGYSDYREVFVSEIDYDGDGTVEGMYHEIEGMRAILYTGLQRYAKGVVEQPIGWADQFPYFFNDNDGDGTLSEKETVFPNAYSSLTPRLMRAAFNFQFSAKAPAGYVHNGKYILQLLYDTAQDLSSVVSVDTSTLVRPE